MCQYFIFLNDKITKSIDKSYNFFLPMAKGSTLYKTIAKGIAKNEYLVIQFHEYMKVFIKIHQIKIHIICNTYMRLSST